MTAVKLLFFLLLNMHLIKTSDANGFIFSANGYSILNRQHDDESFTQFTLNGITHLKLNYPLLHCLVFVSTYCELQRAPKSMCRAPLTPIM